MILMGRFFTTIARFAVPMSVSCSFDHGSTKFGTCYLGTQAQNVVGLSNTHDVPVCSCNVSGSRFVRMERECLLQNVRSSEADSKCNKPNGQSLCSGCHFSSF